LGVAAHRVGAAGIEALARMEYTGIDAGAERADPAEPEMRREDVLRAAPVRVERAVEEDAVVAIVGEGERRRVLEVEPRDVSLRRRERNVGPVDESGKRDRRQRLVRAERADGERVANAEVDAEIHVARVHAV